MIKYLVIENLFSFNGKVAVNFENGVNVIYGKNNGGKKNLLNVIKLWSDVLSGKIFYDEKYLSKLSKSNFFSVKGVFDFENYDYCYEFEFNDETKSYVKESLTSESENLITVVNGVITSDVLSNEQINSLMTFDIEKISVMSVINNIKDINGEINKIKQIKSLYNFINDDNRNNQTNVMKVINEKIDLKQMVLDQLKSADLDIIDFEIKENKRTYIVNDKNGKMKEKNVLEYEMIIKHCDYDMPIEFESSGTKVFFNKIADIIVCLETNKKIIMFEEIENFLHNELFKRLLQILKLSELQVFISTHNQVVLEEKLFPKKNILIIDKNTSKTEIYSLGEIPDLRNTSRHNWKNFYNEDKFGGFPDV